MTVTQVTRDAKVTQVILVTYIITKRIQVPCGRSQRCIEKSTKSHLGDKKNNHADFLSNWPLNRRDTYSHIEQHVI